MTALTDLQTAITAMDASLAALRAAGGSGAFSMAPDDKTDLTTILRSDPAHRSSGSYLNAWHGEIYVLWGRNNTTRNLSTVVHPLPTIDTLLADPNYDDIDTKALFYAVLPYTRDIRLEIYAHLGAPNLPPTPPTNSVVATLRTVLVTVPRNFQAVQVNWGLEDGKSFDARITGTITSGQAHPRKRIVITANDIAEDGDYLLLAFGNKDDETDGSWNISIGNVVWDRTYAGDGTEGAVINDFDRGDPGAGGAP